MLLQLFVRLCIIVVYLRHDANCADHHNDQENNDASKNSVRHQNWKRLEIMDGNGLYLLQWWLHEKDIYFRVTVNTRGFIGLGFSRRDGRMSSADMVLLWVDDHTGKANALVRLLSLLLKTIS